MKTLLLVLAALGGAWWATLPPPRGAVSAFDPHAGMRGAFHVHTSRSDGTGSVAEVAAAAARAGLQFVVFTDHGDGTREPDPPQYIQGVLCIDAVEISVREGHLIALGLGKTPYPLGGEGRDVLDDIERLGGFGVAAHPGSAKPELQWGDWELPIAGLEWMNGDSEWRDESAWRLLRGVLAYPARPVEALALMLDRPDDVLRQWDRLTTRRRLSAIAGADAHARLGFQSLGEPYTDGPALEFPSYERVFEVFSNVLPGVSITGDAEADAGAVLGAIRDGRLYSVVDAVGGPAAFTFSASGGGLDAGLGGAIPLASPVTLHVAAPAVDGVEIRLFRSGERVEDVPASRLDHVVGSDVPGAYRVEVFRSGSPGDPAVPWIVSNPIYVGTTHMEEAAPGRPPARSTAVQYGNGPATSWSIETSPGSLAALDVAPSGTGTALALRYGVGGAASGSPYAAFAMTAGPALAEHDRLIFTARSDRPMRLSVQLRAPGGPSGERWQRSVYIDETSREIAVWFDDMRPAMATSDPRPALSRIDSILFVVDTVNTPLGGNGRIWLDDVKYGR